MSRYSVFTWVLVSSIIVFDNAIQQISARTCIAQAVDAVNPRSGGTVQSTQGSGLDYRVDDLSHCESCLRKIPTVQNLKSHTDNPVIKGWTVTFKNGVGTLDYNLQECEGDEGVNFWVKTTKSKSEYAAFYVG